MASSLPLHVDRWGDGDHSIVLLHGFGANSFEWRGWVTSLAQDHKVWAVDLKGHGSAPAPQDGHYSPHDHAELVHRFIVQEDVRQLTLIGHSMGGGIALLVALRLLSEGRLERLVLVAGAAYPQPLPPFVKLARMGRLTKWILAITPKRWLIRQIIRSITYDPAKVRAAQVEAYAKPLRSAAHRLAIIRTALQIIPGDLADITARYPDINVPTLLLWGRHDLVVPLSVGEKLLSVLPKAQLVILEECGHLPSEELPRESLEIILNFISEGDASSF